ncbi:MAG TPA: DUF368 domain-containing protein [Candidatus Avacidaminococcus intestinavium]|uniref:DUF368 domain-containing protein n=1 Tax=Candidatus Avacidaminococcus intestinavium TaxID=2840684 RepID=A0A9D1SL21_9FIRM|nr:DUF368 domain-containing protein [Candidatus Avacidaminococcus intestinavium]
MHKEKIIIILKGMLIGVTMLVPGVSGGSMAIILGIYNKLVAAVSSFFKHKKESVIFLTLFMLGSGSGMILFAKPLLQLIEKFPMPMLYFFMGTVAGSVQLILRQAEVRYLSWKVAFYILLGIAIVQLLAMLPLDFFRADPSGGSTSILLLLTAGFISAIALVLPGISVSYMLLMLGIYDTTMRSISELNFPFLVPLGIGVILGVLLTTKILETLMLKHPRPTYLMIFGFVLGSLGELYPGLPAGIEIIICLFTLLTGFFAIRFLHRT